MAYIFIFTFKNLLYLSCKIYLVSTQEHLGTKFNEIPPTKDFQRYVDTLHLAWLLLLLKESILKSYKMLAEVNVTRLGDFLHFGQTL